MSFSEFANDAKNLITKAIGELGFPKPGGLSWSEPPNADLGDLSFSLSFELGKQLRKKPMQIAQAIASKSSEINVREKHGLVSSIEPCEPGFVNIRLDRSSFSQTVLSGASNQHYGRSDTGARRTVIVEHTAVNPNKAAHIGHARNIAVGDSVARILSFAGYDTHVINYIDDTGPQVADLIVGMTYMEMPKDAPADQKYDHYAGNVVYVAVNRAYEQDAALLEKRKAVLKAVEERDSRIWNLARSITDRILREQLRTFWRLGAFYELMVFESDIVATRLWDSTFEQLKRDGIAKYQREGKLAGCWTVTVRGEAEGEDKVLVRSDGTITYVAKDTPFAALKLGLIADKFSYSKYVIQPNGKELWRTSAEEGGTHRSPVPWGADKSITVIGSEQARLQRIILYILEQLKRVDLNERYIHLGYAMVSVSSRTLSYVPKSQNERVVDTPEFSESKERAREKLATEGITMSGRKGTYINTDDVLNILKFKALEETKKRNPEIADESWLENVSEKVAVAALRFNLLKQDLDKMIVFDMEDSLQMLGETGPYLMYSYARASSIISKSGLGSARCEARGDASVLTDPTEVNLIMLISKFGVAVERSAAMLQPKWIARYSLELCEAFNQFYERKRVMQEPDQKIREARIALVTAFMSVLEAALQLLGIEVLDKI